MTADRELARLVLADQPLTLTLARLADTARRAIDVTSEVSVTMISAGGHPGTVAHSAGAQAATALDRSQYASGAGPGLDAARDGQVIQVDVAGTGTGGRYADFADRARRIGVGHSLSVGAPPLHETRVAINIYGSGAELGPHARPLAVGFASYAAIAMVNSALHAGAFHEVENMRAALSAGALIEQAKGIVMGRRRCSEQQALHLLQDTAARTDRTLPETARDVVTNLGRSS